MHPISAQVSISAKLSWRSTQCTGPSWARAGPELGPGNRLEPGSGAGRNQASEPAGTRLGAGWSRLEVGSDSDPPSRLQRVQWPGRGRALLCPLAVAVASELHSYPAYGRPVGFTLARSCCSVLRSEDARPLRGSLLF